MSEIGESTSSSVSQRAQEELHGCAWSSCKKNHNQKIVYPSTGRYEKGTSYRERWIAAGMRPWELTAYGQGKRRLRRDGKSYKTSASEYKVQAHHLIPTALLKETTTLKSNLVLVGYDCDAQSNGMVLPEFQMDVPLHQLPSHRGNHPADYMTPIRNELRQIEILADGICSVDVDGTMTSQKRTSQAVEALSNRAKAKILAIRAGKNFWPLRTHALEEYNEALREYARREQLYNKLQEKAKETSEEAGGRS
jgi:hypothetical protein